MTKLEELTALLVNEINEFKKGVEKLGKINNQINDTKIKMDVSEYKTIIEGHQKQMDIHKNLIEGFESRFNNKIKEAKMYPTWAVVVFMICIIATIILISYMILK
tara:strand:- start:10957 stop:11271 length:315 start_codon:yes stop_codon:yes gene_type:complete